MKRMRISNKRSDSDFDDAFDSDNWEYEAFMQGYLSS